MMRRTFGCQAVKNGVRCGKRAMHEEPEGLCLCEGCHRKYITARGKILEQTARA